jgi:hypothetical protein
MIPLEKVVILVDLYNCSIHDLAKAYSHAREEWERKNQSNLVTK